MSLEDDLASPQERVQSMGERLRKLCDACKPAVARLEEAFAQVAASWGGSCAGYHGRIPSTAGTCVILLESLQYTTMTTRERITNGVAWLGKELARMILAPVAGWLVSLAALALLAVALMARKGLVFFTASHPVPGWAILLAVILILIALFFVARQRVQVIRLGPRREHTYTSHGLEWVLSPEFFSNCRYLLLGQFSPSLLQNMIRGPFCPNCKRDATIPAQASDKCACGRKFNVREAKEGGLSYEQATDARSFLERVREEVYMEAQAAVRRNEL